MAAVDIVTEVYVPGIARTKGSLKIQGKRLVEVGAHSKEWRRLVAYSVKRDRERRGMTLPAMRDVGVRVVAWLPVNDDGVMVGDLDKIVRNVLDALGECRNTTDASLCAGAYVDDVQVVRLMAEKVPCRDERAPGTLIQCWAISELSLSMGASAAEHDLRMLQGS